MFVNIILAVLSYKTKTLTTKGAMMAFLLGVVIYYVCKEAYTVLFLYFVGITITEKCILREKNERRNSKQVLSNFLFAFISLLLFITLQEQRYFVLYCSMLSVSICDTLASTVGTRFAKNVYSITQFKKVDKGISGGVSLCGSVAGVFGSVFIALIYFLITQSKADICEKNNIHILLICVLGIFGMMIDSVLGDLLQKKYYCQKCKKTMDKETCCGSANIPVGTCYLTNSQVNIISEGITFVFGLLVI